MSNHLRRLIAFVTFALLMAVCARDTQLTQATAPVSTEMNSIPSYALRPSEGWHVAGQVTVQPAPNGDHLLTVSVIGPDAEVMQRYGWWVAAFACDEFGTFAQYHKPKLYFPGTKIERSRMFYRTEDWFTDSGRRSFTITTQPDWTAEPFSVSAFVSTNGTGKLVTCADLPALT